MAETTYRHSRQRLMILEELRKLTSHPTADTLYEIVRRKLPNISLGTVYRNLELLARMGEIQKLNAAGRQARFDGNPADHFHVQCVRCGRVDDIHAPPLDLPSGETNDSNGYELLGCTVRFHGICPRCNNSSTKSNNQQEI